MALRINSEAPNFTAETSEGKINFHEWIGNGWAILFSHPKDFTPVCTTELGYMAGLKPQFDKRNCKIIGLSVDPVADHQRWSKDIEETQGHAVTYPMIGDPELKVAKAYDMLPETAGTTAQGRTPADNATVRSVFVIGPDKKIKAMLTYPMSTGRNFDEVLRLLDSCQLTTKHKVATPVNWKQGQDVIFVVGDRGDDDHVLALLPVHRRGHLVLGRELAGVQEPQHLVEVAAGGHRIGQHRLDLLVRADDEHRAHRRVVGGGPALGGGAGRLRQHVVGLRHLQFGVPDEGVG